MARVLIIGDTHIPYELASYRAFCKKMANKYKVNRVVHIGDLVDHHSLSFHDSEPCLQGADGELIDARKRLKPWIKSFPKLTLVAGNHDKIPARQLKRIGLDPDVWLQNISSVYGLPKAWKVVDELEIDGVLYVHGEGATGTNGFRNLSIKKMQSTVTGHAHGNCGISFTASPKAKIFGMTVGCGIDNKEMAFAYGKPFPNKPIIGCGLVIDGKPYVETMDLGGY